MKVLIVSKTRMAGSSRCVGAIAEDGTSLRLLDPNGQNWNTSTKFAIGDRWELTYKPKTGSTAPHTEDVICTHGSKIDTVADIREAILGLAPVWSGGISEVFDGLLGFTAKKNGYISQARGVPSQSTGFWMPDRDLQLRSDGKHYDYPHRFFGSAGGMSYVGEPSAIETIPSGTLIRVSLARWWKPDDVDDLEERCYAQLSGWY